MTASPPRDCDVLIAGGGPTGLVLAIWLTRLGVRVRIVDKAGGPGTTSRALAVQVRTLEFYAQLGMADAVIDRGVKVAALNWWVEGKRKARAPFGDLGAGLTRFPFALIFPQDEHERFLVERLEALGVRVERNTTLDGFEETADGIHARITTPRGGDTCHAAFLAGCDGAHSVVRTALGIGFPGGTYEHLFYVADIDGRGPVVNGELHVEFEANDFLAVFPMKGGGRVRLVGTVRQTPGDTRELTWNDVSKTAIERLGLEVARVNWFSTYRVHHRVAGAFQRGRAFLCGDAAHIHSPVGGQGMNTGIGDAVNLAWKLAAVVRQAIDPAMLQTYEQERIAFARSLVETTDQGFTVATSSTFAARTLRTAILPAVIPRLFAIPLARREMFRTVSQIRINYRGSNLSAGRAGKIRGGDRLPWVESSGRDDNLTPLTSLDWQIHVYGAAPPQVRSLATARGLMLHVFGWDAAAEQAGLQRDGAYLVRPDGYVGCASAPGDAGALDAYLTSRRVTPLRPIQ